jgi:cytochrome P450
MAGRVLFHLRRLAASHALEGACRLISRACAVEESLRTPAPEQPPPPSAPRTPEDFRPLEHSCFQNPYAFYKMLRDDYPVYRLPNGVFCISRHEDIVTMCRDPETYSSTHQGLVPGLSEGMDIEKLGGLMDRVGSLGIIPPGVLATSDPPVHTRERKAAYKGFDLRSVRLLDPMIEELASEMLDEAIDDGQMEFMQQFAWRLPMHMIIRLLGFPADDYDKIKCWCEDVLSVQTGVAPRSQQLRGVASTLAFIRYCWTCFLEAKANPRDDLSRVFVDAVNDPDNPFDDNTAVSAIFQVLVAGSDSSASSMGNALKMLIENPHVADEIRADMDTKLPAFVEEVLRLESAFQGHFRWALRDSKLGGVELPRGSRIFLMWASGNRDERVFEDPDEIRLDRKPLKRHLTFGHGIHLCLGRELARAEIRIALREFLTRTRNLRIDGETPFIASMFSRTLVQLPITFDRVEELEATRRHDAA